MELGFLLYKDTRNHKGIPSGQIYQEANNPPAGGLFVSCILYLGYYNKIRIIGVERNLMNETILNPLWAMWVQFLSALTLFMPKLVATVVLLLIGITIARTIKFLVVRGLEKFRLSTAVKKTPVEHFFDNPEIGHKVEEAIGSVVYWLVMLIVLHTVFTIIGLNSLSLILEKIISYLPHVISATFVLFFGVIVAGLVESFVKGTIKTIDGKSARLFGKVASYLSYLLDSYPFFYEF